MVLAFIVMRIIVDLNSTSLFAVRSRLLMAFGSRALSIDQFLFAFVKFVGLILERDWLKWLLRQPNLETNL